MIWDTLHISCMASALCLTARLVQVDWSKYLDQDDEESGADKYTPDTESMNPMAQVWPLTPR